MTFRQLIGCLSLALVGTATGQEASRPTPPPPEDFFKPPAYSQVTLSPDGNLLAALIPINGRRNLALIDLAKGKAIALTAQTDDDVRSYRWLGDRVVEAETADLDQTGGVTSVHQHVLIDVVDQRAIRDLQAMSRFGIATVLDAVDRDGAVVLVETHDRNVTGTDVFRIDARTGEKKLLTFQSPGDVRRFIADRNGQVRVAVSVPRGGERTVVSYRRTNDDKWTTLRDEPTANITFDPVDFDFDDRTLYVRVPDRERGGRADIYAFDTETGQMGARIFESRAVDAGAVVADWVKRKIVGVRDVSDDGVEWLDPQWKQLQASIDAALPKARNRIAWARDNTDRVLIANDTATQPTIYYVLDRRTMSMERVAASYPQLKEENLSPRLSVTYAARDGLSIPAFLTMPKHPDGAKPPLIVNIHGGPFVPGWRPGYDPEAQFFASRGYAVLEPNFRGTTGYGAAFERAGWRQWGLAMQDDITDGVKWLVDTGRVDPDRVCLFGASYGGYATLWGLEKEPAMFRCGIAFLAVSDLELMFDVTWSDFMRYERGGEMTNNLTRTLGDPSKDREKMRAVSPVNHADRIQAPLLLAYGATDERVPLIHGTKMRSALEAAHKPYEWVLYDDQKHMRFDPVNGADFYRRVDAFLAKNFAPRTQTAAAPGEKP